jgi:hypothetical protein
LVHLIDTADSVLNKMSFSQKHNNIFNNVKFAACFGYSNHHQVDISVHGHDMFSAYSMGSHIVYIYCVEFQTFRVINCSIFNILTNVYSEIIYEPINVGSHTVSNENVMSMY